MGQTRAGIETNSPNYSVMAEAASPTRGGTTLVLEAENLGSRRGENGVTGDSGAGREMVLLTGSSWRLLVCGSITRTELL